MRAFWIGRDAQGVKYGSGVKTTPSKSKRFHTATVGGIEIPQCGILIPPTVAVWKLLFSYESDFGIYTHSWIHSDSSLIPDSGNIY